MTKKAWSYIHASLSQKYRFVEVNIEERNPATLWFEMNKLYNVQDTQHEAELVRELNDFKWEKEDKVDTYLKRMLILRSKYKKAKMSLTKKTAIKHICLKLPSEYGQLKSLINLNPKISWHEVRRIFIDKEKELSEVSEDGSQSSSVDDAQAFFNAKAKKYYRSKRPPKPEKITCHFCGEEGHMRLECKWKNVYRSMGF
jgi:hypothetical protein